MHAFLVLADAASSHPDGTFSLLRGGISELNIPSNQPAHFKGALVARVVGDRGEAGPHEVKVKCVTEDGASILPDLTAMFELPPKGGAVHLVMDMQMVFPTRGRFEFSIFVDKHQLDTWVLEVKDAKPQEKK